MQLCIYIGFILDAIIMMAAPFEYKLDVLIFTHKIYTLKSIV